MRRIRAILLIICGGLLAILLWNSEPLYQGHSLSDWLELRGGYSYGNDHWANLPEFDRAIRSIGPRAVPFMLRWIRSVPHSRLNIVNRGLPIAIVRAILKKDDRWDARATGAIAAFEILGSNAVSALPELARIASAPPNPDWENHDPAWGIERPWMPNRRAIFALANIGPLATPYLLSLATNQSVNIQCDAVYLLSRMGTNALSATPLLLEDIQHPTNKVAHMAVRTLGALKASPEIVIPALTNILEDRGDYTPYLSRDIGDPRLIFFYEAFTALGAYGPAARPAFPTLLRWLNDPDPLLPEYAADALGKLALEPEIVVPALKKVLDGPNPYLRRTAARSLGAFGSSAVSAVPTLIKVIESTNGMHLGRSQAEESLKRITNSVQETVSEPAPP